MIEALFGSKTRVKLLHLFLNNPGKSFYVREITRLIDEQINSVRRELSNLLQVGVITSRAADDNKLYYEIDQRYEYFEPFREIFTDSRKSKTKKSNHVKADDNNSWQTNFGSMKGIRVVVAAGILVRGSVSQIDILIVGSVPGSKLTEVISKIEKEEGRQVNYAILPYDEFYYRLSIRDKFIMQVITGKYEVIIDTDNILSE